MRHVHFTRLPWFSGSASLPMLDAVFAVLTAATSATAWLLGGWWRQKSLYSRIASFYDKSTWIWEDVWGDHLHHGFYGRDGKRGLDHRAAQEEMIAELLRFGDVGAASEVVDLGCGVGGSSRALARRFGARVVGITLSPKQVESANRRTALEGLEQQCSFQVANAMEAPFADGSFDLVWSMESAEHMPDKHAFVGECSRLLKPGGTLLIATWCHRPVPSASLSRSERQHLQLISYNYALPDWVPIDDFVSACARHGLREVRTDDWTQAIQPFWPAVIRSALRPSSLIGLLRAGWTTISAALTGALMLLGFKRGLIKFVVLAARKPLKA